MLRGVRRDTGSWRYRSLLQRWPGGGAQYNARDVRLPTPDGAGGRATGQCLTDQLYAERAGNLYWRSLGARGRCDDGGITQRVTGQGFICVFLAAGYTPISTLRAVNTDSRIESQE